MMESGDSDRVLTCAGDEEGELARLRSEVERLTSERDQAQGLLREATAETLSTRTAVAALREAWRASAEHAAIFATDDPQTPEQWRAFGGVETARACADELDPEKADSFEPCDLAKARAEAERLARENAALSKALNEFSCECGKDWMEAKRNGLAVPKSMCAHHRARVALEQIDAPSPRRVRHKKRGTTYAVIGEDFRLQSSRPIEEGETLAIYRGDDGKGWARPLDEFTDGRFEPEETRS
jgi:hypothetical protein